jgi:hypothetical protein
MKSITVYSTGCARCNVLLAKMKLAGITWYNIIDDVEIMKKEGIEEVPMIRINDGPLMNFKEAIEWVNKMGE